MAKIVDKSTPLKALIIIRRREYSRQKPIYSQFMQETVYFNNEGFFHATHDGRGKMRGDTDARLRLNLLKDVAVVV